MKPTDENPCGVETFALDDFAASPEMDALVGAMDAFIKATSRSHSPLPQDEWLKAVQHLAAAVPFADNCPACQSCTYPCGADVEEQWLDARYRCGCGEQWTCGWSPTAPLFGPH